MRLDESCDPVYARHETFHPRYGWIKKGYDAAAQHGPDFFNKEVAVVRMGVGKNMVKSIRHWSLAFKVLESIKTPGRRLPTIEPSAVGRAWFDDGSGVDPYMELPGTDWLLHWWLLAPPCQAPVWWVAFNEFTAIEFTEEQLLSFVLDRLGSFGRPNGSSVKKDVSVLLRMYSSGHLARATFEDKIDCPFRELGLLQPSASEPGGYRFLVGPKVTLPSEVFAATVIDFSARAGGQDRVINLSRALTEPGSPGRAFRLTDAAVMDLLDEAAGNSKAIDIKISNGMPQLVLSSSPAQAMRELLATHYAQFDAALNWPLPVDPEGTAA